MDWTEIQQMTTERIIPELDSWALELAEPLRPFALEKSHLRGFDGTPLWIVKSVLKSISPRGVGAIGDVIHGSGWLAPAYAAMGKVMYAKYIPDTDSQRRDFIRRLEPTLLQLGPLDNLDGSGPGKAISVSRDGTGRLHNSDGPALMFADRALYALDGRIIQVHEWAARDDAAEVLKIQNVETRRVLIERLGVARFIRESGMQPTHSDRFGTFYRLAAQGRHHGTDPHGYVHVTCPSTGQEYFLAVPGNCRTAHEAVAWTFSMVPEDYNPAKEA